MGFNRGTSLQFFNPYKEIQRTENRLPHWQRQGAVYFVTCRLADAVPEQLRAQWEEERAIWLRLNPEPWSAETEKDYHNRFSGAIRLVRDETHLANCVRYVRRNPEKAGLGVECILYESELARGVE